MTEPFEWTAEAEVQDTLVRLWTSDEARARFLSDREAYLAEQPISAAARDRLWLLDAGQLDGFAMSLVQKRFSQVRALLFDVATRIPAEFNSRFSAWAASHPPVATHHHQDDARRFGLTLLKIPLATDLRDRLRWRLLLLNLERPGWRFGITRFAHDVRGPTSSDLPRRVTLVVWWSLLRFGRGVRVIW